jgi:nicotinate-nucleotide adenylyltransferase
MKRNIGLMGGSFDPVHEGHIALAQAALETFSLDEVRFMPCAQQALKEHAPATAKDRCAMLRLALANHPQFTLDCREIYRGGKTYTYDTLMALRAEEPEATFWFIIGMDSAQSFSKWYRAEALPGLCEFILFDRPGISESTVPAVPGFKAHRLTGPLLDISSSDIRAAVAEKRPIRYAICDLEERYLRDHNLYL